MNDLINREAAIDALYHHLPEKSREECAAILHEVPSQPERKNGKWIKVEKAYFTRFHPDQPDTYHEYRCTVCLKASDKATNCCPNCGAEMEAVDA